MISLVCRSLPLPATAVVQPLLEGWRGIGIEGMLEEVAPVLHGPPMPPPLARPVQAHGMTPALHLRMEVTKMVCVWYSFYYRFSMPGD